MVYPQWYNDWMMRMKTPATIEFFIKRALNRRFLQVARDANLIMIKRLLQEGVDPNTTNENGETAIILLCGPHVGHDNIQDILEGLRLVHEAGGSLTAKNILQQTALFYAVTNPSSGPIRWLLQNNCHFDLNARDIYGNTCLHGRRDARDESNNMRAEGGPIMVLLLYGINPSITNINGITPMMFCLQPNFEHALQTEYKNINRYFGIMEYLNSGSLPRSIHINLQDFEAEIKELKEVKLNMSETIHDVLQYSLPRMLGVLKNENVKELPSFSETYQYLGIYFDAKIFHATRRLAYHETFYESFQLLLGNGVIEEIFEMICTNFFNTELKRLSEIRFSEYLT